MGMPWYAQVTPLLHELHWLLVCSRVQFKMLKDCLTSAQPIQSCKVGRLQVPLMKQCHLSGPWKQALSVAVLALWNEVPPRDLDGIHSAVI